MKNGERHSMKIKTKILKLDEDPEITEEQVMKLFEENAEEITKSELKMIFDELIKNNGKIRKSALIQYISKNKRLSRTSIKTEIENNFQSESEKMMNKLIKLKKLLYDLNQPEAINDVNWIIDTLAKGDIDDYVFVDNRDSEGIEALKIYSQAELKIQRDRDLKTVKVNLKSTTKTPEVRTIDKESPEKERTNSIQITRNLDREKNGHQR